MNKTLGNLAMLLGVAGLLAIGVTDTAIAEVPSLADKVAAGELPPMAERLPEKPMKIDFAAEGKSPGKYGGRLRLLMARAKDIGQMTVYSYARLVGYNRDLELKPDILQSVDVEDGRIFTFTLRKGHKWSDGHPFTTEDFRYYWEDMIAHEDLGRTGTPPDMLVDGTGPKFEIIDERTVRYTWQGPNPAFLPALARPAALYLYRPAHYLKQYHASYRDQAELDAIVEERGLKNWVSLHTRAQRQRRPEDPNLPTLQAWRNTVAPPSQRFIFERNPYYHRTDSDGNQLPYIDSIIMYISSKDVIPAKAGTGEADLQARYLRFDNYTFLKGGEEAYGFKVHLWGTGKGAQVALFPNLNVENAVWRGLMRDVRFRRALSLAIDRDEINESIYFGLASPSANTVMPSSPLFDEGLRTAWATYDPGQANQLLDQAGLGARDSDGVRLLPSGERAEITIESAGESTEETDVLELIADHWEAVGIKLFVRASQRDIFRRRAYTGETMISVFSGFDNALATADMSPQELAPTARPQLQWPKWGQFYETAGKAGEPPQLPEVIKQLELYLAWTRSRTVEERSEIWRKMLTNYTDQVFTIGTVNNSRQPVVVSNKLRNVPEDGVYAWEPTAVFGVYRPDTFWFSE